MSTTRLNQWDIFISHASEDKISFVAPLAKALSDFGIKVWYDEFELRLGDSLSRSIDADLAKSNFGLVILSPAFLLKKWTEYELRGLNSREMAGDSKVILPIWHKLAYRDIVAFSPTLADKVAIKTDNLQPVEIAHKIIETVRPDLFTQIQRRLAFHERMKTAQLSHIPLANLKISPVKYSSISQELISRIRMIRACLLEVHPHSMENWLDGFLRDEHPSMEVSCWERIAAVYMEYISTRTQLTEDQRRAVFSYILVLSMSLDEDVLGTDLDKIPDGARGIIKKSFGSSLPTEDFAEEALRPNDSEIQSDRKSAVPESEARELYDYPNAIIDELIEAKNKKIR